AADVRGRRGRTTDETMVSPSEGNEVRREGLQGVAAPHSSVEAGERPFRTPWSEGGATLWTGSWNHAEDICASPACHRETTQSCEGQRFPNVTNRMRLTRTSGSVGAPGSNPWSDPACFQSRFQSAGDCQDPGPGIQPPPTRPPAPVSSGVTKTLANIVPAVLLCGKIVQSKTQKPGYPFPP